MAGAAAWKNARMCIQIHGGMGFTWEIPAHYYLKRAWVLESVFGDFEGALGQIDRMEEVFGSETDAKEFRAQVRSARTEQREQEVDRDLVGFEEILAQHAFCSAART